MVLIKFFRESFNKLYIIFQNDEQTIFNIIENKTTTGNVIGPYPRFYYMWENSVKFIENAMVFGPQGLTSKTLDFLVFCNETSQKNTDALQDNIVDNIRISTVKSNKPEVNTITDGDITTADYNNTDDATTHRELLRVSVIGGYFKFNLTGC